jgi:hypothetical protein
MSKRLPLTLMALTLLGLAACRTAPVAAPPPPQCPGDPRCRPDQDQGQHAPEPG